MIYNIFINILSLFIPSKRYKKLFKSKYKKMLSSNKLENQIVFFELPTIKDSSNHLVHHFEGLDYKIVDAFDKDQVRAARKKAKILISEGALCKKYKNQIAVEIWHASGFIKNACNLKRPDQTHLDWVICPSVGMIDTYAKAFGVEKDKVLPLGSVKTDYYFDKEKCNSIKNSFYDKYPKLRDKKIYTWAPTFRGDWRESPHFFTSIDLDIIDKKLKDDEVLLIKLHPSLKYFNSKEDLRTNALPLKKHKKIIDVSDDLLNEVTLVSDVFISDYSSCILDAMVANIPVIFFAEDIDDYAQNTGMPFDYRKDVPNLLEKCSEDELLQQIRNIKVDTKKYVKFKQEWLGACDGKAGQRVLQFVKSMMDKSHD